ncbi:MAG: hypothetical protein QW706_10030 [Candidatus Nezhaarchaeales archaeon]
MHNILWLEKLLPEVVPAMRLWGRKSIDKLDELANDIFEAYRRVLDARRKGRVSRGEYYVLLLKTAELSLYALISYGLSDSELKSVLESIASEVLSALKGGNDEQEGKVYG